MWLGESDSSREETPLCVTAARSNFKIPCVTTNTHKTKQARRADERDAARRRAAAAKEAFAAMLEECTELRPADGFRAARELLEADPRWRAVASDDDRLELFEAHARALEARARAAARARSSEAREAFLELLRRERVAAGDQWRRVAPKLEGRSAYEALEPAERLALFQEHQRALEDAARQERERAREEERREERLRREAFRELVRRHM